MTAHDAEDVAQDAVIRAYRNRMSCHAPERPWPWLSAITHHEAMRRSAARKPAADIEQQPERGAVDPAIERLPEQLTLRPAVASLDERDRAIVFLHYHQDATVAAIARTTGIPIGTVKVKLKRIRAKLAVQLTS